MNSFEFGLIDRHTIVSCACHVDNRHRGHSSPPATLLSSMPPPQHPPIARRRSSIHQINSFIQRESRCGRSLALWS